MSHFYRNAWPDSIAVHALRAMGTASLLPMLECMIPLRAAAPPPRRAPQRLHLPATAFHVR